MAYTAWSVVFGEQPTAAKWNQLGANDAGFKDGTNIDNLAILTRHIAALNITKAKLEAAVTDMLDYSNTEKLTGFLWINGKAIYKKTINCGTMPNSGSSTIAHSISGMTAVIEYRGIGMNISGMQFIDFQHGNGTNVFIDATNVNIATTISRSQFTAYVTLWYTK